MNAIVRYENVLQTRLVTPDAPVTAARSSAGCVSARQADRLALALAVVRHRMSVPLARAARAFVRAEAWCFFGYARARVITHESALADRAAGSLTWRDSVMLSRLCRAFLTSYVVRMGRNLSAVSPLC